MTTVYVLIFFIIGLSSLNLTYSQNKCDNSSSYQTCSLNPGCGCLPLSSNNRSAVCAFLRISCSELSSCARDNKTCYQPGYTCVKHSRCQQGPICYPMQMATESVCPPPVIPPIPDNVICENATWNVNGTTVAGGNGSGSALNQLKYPSGILLDDDLNLYVVDGFNHRVVKWNHGSSTGQLVAGGNGEGNRTDQFRYPNAIAISKNGTIYICDNGNHRIQKWNRNAIEGETMISNISCYALFIDNQDSFYYTDEVEQAILKWPENEVIAGGNGEGNHLNQFSFPYDFFIKNNKSLYITDGDNHRVLEWTIGDKEGVVKAGGNGPGNKLNQLYQPMSVVVDQSDSLYIADYDNNRIMRWLKDSKSGILIAGKGGQGTKPDQLYRPSQALLDKYGNLWVNDDMNHRIQMFAIDKSSCKKT